MNTLLILSFLTGSAELRGPWHVFVIPAQKVRSTPVPLAAIQVDAETLGLTVVDIVEDASRGDFTVTCKRKDRTS